MVRLSIPLTAAWLSAQDRALEDRAAGRRPVRIAPNTYRVPASRTGVAPHTVTIRNAGALDAVCDCEHGRSGGKGHCRHAASALMAELERVSRKPPAPVPAPAPKFTPEQVNSFMARFARQ